MVDDLTTTEHTWKWVLWRESRSWRLRIHLCAGAWFSLGIHVDAAPKIDVHLGWWIVSFGRLRDCITSGWQLPRSPRMDW